mgnify:CR=1 FL=1
MIRWVSRASQRSLVAATLLLCFTAMNAWSQDVALTSADGTLTIEGRLLSFDGEYYQIRSAYGDLTLDGSGVHCQGPGCPSVNAFIAKARIVGATALGETLMPVLIEGFASQEGLDLRRVERAAGDFSLELMNSDTGEVVAEFQFELSDTLTGFAALEAEEADFALARFAYEGTKFGTPRVLGLDAVTFSVAAENPMRAVPLDALTQILRGQVENWAELGGPDLPLIAMGEVDEVDDQLTATTAFMAEESQTLSGQVVDRVSDDSISIGLTRLSDPGGAVALDLLGGCDVGFVASPQNLKTGDYPFASPQFLYQSANRKPRIIRQFLRYLATDSAARDAEFSGFVSHNLIEIPLEAQGTRIANAVVQAGNDVNLQDLQEMMAELRDAQRLTLTFRFRKSTHHAHPAIVKLKLLPTNLTKSHVEYGPLF